MLIKQAIQTPWKVSYTVTAPEFILDTTQLQPEVEIEISNLSLGAVTVRDQAGAIVDTIAVSSSNTYKLQGGFYVLKSTRAIGTDFEAILHNHDDRYYTETEINSQMANKADLVAGKVPSSQLPSYVDDVLEYANLAGFPATGTTGIIYVALDTNKTYRWSGSAYTEISPSDVNSVAGKTGIVTLVKADVGLANVDNTSDANKPISTATQTALNLKADDSNTFHKTGNESASGLKTFTNQTTFGDGFNAYFGNFSGGNPVGGTSLNQQIMEYNGGGYKHYIISHHNAGTGNNQIRYFLNNSATPNGSTSAGTGNTEVMMLDDSAGVHIYKNLVVEGTEARIENAKSVQRRLVFANTTDSHQMIIYQPVGSNDLRIYNTNTFKDVVSFQENGNTNFNADVVTIGSSTFSKLRLWANSGNSGRASQIDQYGIHASDGTKMRFTWYADRDSAVVGNDTLQLWGYPENNAGGILDFAQLMTITYDRTTNKTDFDMQRDKVWVAYTPTIIAQSGSGHTYSKQQGWYKLVGSECHFHCELALSGLGTSSGSLEITLPFTPSPSEIGNDRVLSGFACGVGSNPATANAGIPVIDGAGRIAFLNGVDTGVLTFAGVSTNTRFRVTGSYSVAR